jgi:hypothetical protein
MKRLICLLGLLLCLYMPSYAQVSIAQNSDFSILSPPIGASLAMSAPYAFWYNATGSPIYGMMIDADSLNRVAKGKERYWVVRVTSNDTTAINSYGGSNTGIAVVNLAIFDGTTSLGSSNKTITLPKNLHIYNTTLIPGVSIMFDFGRGVKVGDAIYVYEMTHQLQYSRNRAFATYYNQPIDSLTIIGKDTLAVADSSISVAIPGDKGYVTLFVKMDSVARISIGYQVKQNGSSLWSCKLDTLLTARWFSISDSLITGTDQRAISASPSIVSDSIRYRIKALTTAVGARTLIDYIVAKWRD